MALRPHLARGVLFRGQRLSPPLLCGVWATGGANTGLVRRPSAFHPRTRLSAPFGYPGVSMCDASTSTGWRGAVGTWHVVAHATIRPKEGPTAAQQVIGIDHVAWQRPARLSAVPVVRRARPPGRNGRPVLCESSDTPTSTPRARRASRIGRTWTAQPRLMDWCPSISRPFALGGRVEARRVEARGAVDRAALDPPDPAPRIADRPAALAPEAGFQLPRPLGLPSSPGEGSPIPASCRAQDPLSRAGRLAGT